uniref:Peptidase A1 domain-containing protein n=1 Tax=Elaeophora elaphi TaxID=1147741 RepID=A0A0R3RHM5_9BILA
MTEKKKDLKFSEDGNTVYYKSYKDYFYAPEISCPECRDNPELILPNVAALGAVTTMIQEKDCGATCRLIVDIGLLLMGEYPFRKLRPLNVTFYGYSDSLLSLVNSPIFKFLDDKFNDGKSIIPLNIPHLSSLALFSNLNSSNDEYYVIETGKRDINSIGKIRNWAGSNLLPPSWWQTTQARMINGTDTGSFAPWHLTPRSILPFFSSFLCRSFTAVFSKHSSYKGMKTVEFVVPEEEFDTVNDNNIGFRYRNLEKIKYFPEWEPCPKKTRRDSGGSCSNESIECSLKRNLCHVCCEGSYVDGTYLLPPGMFPLVCFPGKNVTLPMSAVISSPYFSYSPKEVIDSVIGFRQLDVKPSVFTFVREPMTGLLMRIDTQMMVSFPVFQTDQAT